MPVPSFVSAIGGITSTSSCTPGADLWVTVGGSWGFSAWVYAGLCPESGSVVCGAATVPFGTTVQTFIVNQMIGPLGVTGGTCFQDTRTIGGGTGGGSTAGGTTGSGGTVTLQPAELSAQQRADIYDALGLVFAAGLAALAVIWGMKRIVKILDTGARWGD